MSRDPAKTAKTLLDASEHGASGRSLGDMGFDSEGHLVWKRTDGVYNYQFTYAGYQFAVRAETGDDGTRMRIHTILGNLPYTAESKELRANVLAIVEAASDALGGRLRVNAEQRIMLLDEFVMDEVLTPVSLFSKTVEFLLSAKPYLELLGFVAGAGEVMRRFAAERALPAPEA